LAANTSRRWPFEIYALAAYTCGPSTSSWPGLCRPPTSFELARL
jgi:hypothetical protein